MKELIEKGIVEETTQEEVYSMYNNIDPVSPKPLTMTGEKHSKGKAPIKKLFRQFPLTLEQVAFRTAYGHEKYKETDHDYMNWKRIPNAISEYEDAAGRHNLNLGEEDELGHLAAEIWNLMAVLQLKLEQLTTHPSQRR